MSKKGKFGFYVKQVVAGVLYFLLLWYASKHLLQAFGEKPHTVQTLALCVFASIFCAYKQTYWLLILPLSILVGIYGPVGFMYGKPSYQFIISFYATSFSEASEFLSQFSVPYLIKSFSIPVFAFLAYLVSRKEKLRPWRNKTYVFIVAVILILCGRPTPFFDTLKTSFMQVESENKELQNLMAKNSWDSVETDAGDKDYILVIGESVRRDYLSSYGYPIFNTPFLSSSKQATIVEGLISPSHYTAGSLRLMLTYPDKIDQEWEPRYGLNIIGLAKKAGFRTVWFSNQGYSGIDTPVTAIAKNADHTIFVTGGAYTASTASDFVLLPMLKSELSRKIKGPRLIVLHTIGSHFWSCKRIVDMPYVYTTSDNSYEELACYVSSIRKADQFLERVTEILNNHTKKNRRSFSLIWFSDHGQTQIVEEGKHGMRHREKAKSNFEVPLVKIDSKTIKQERIKSFKSGLRFTCGLAGWMNIKAANLPSCDLFDGKDDSDTDTIKRLLKTEVDPPKKLSLEWTKNESEGL